MSISDDSYIVVRRTWRTKVVIKLVVAGYTGFVAEEYSMLITLLRGKHLPQEIKKPQSWELPTFFEKPSDKLSDFK